jgi:hypothetical protein
VRALVLLSALALALPSLSPAAYTVASCPDQGIAKPSGRSGGDPTLNERKNRVAIPPSYSTVTWSDASWNQPAFPKPLPWRRTSWVGTNKNGNDLGAWRTAIEDEEKKAVMVEGILLVSVKEGPESVNCGEKSDELLDYHMYLTEEGGTQDKPHSIVVEITPRIRAKHASWTHDRIMNFLKGKKVRIYGWKLFDQWHRKTTHRRSAWEIHPIMHITYWDTGTNAWTAF